MSLPSSQASWLRIKPACEIQATVDLLALRSVFEPPGALKDADSQALPRRMQSAFGGEVCGKSLQMILKYIQVREPLLWPEDSSH